MTYNSDRDPLIIQEYGRHIQGMVSHLLTLENKEERNQQARSIINVMGQLFPYLRDVEDFRHKLWDHLHIMSNFQLDVDSPYPKPEPQALAAKPGPVPYPGGGIKYGHYGKTVELMIDECIALEEGPKKEQAMLAIGNLMKRFYLTWNRDTVKDEVIANDLKVLSGGKLVLEDPEKLIHSSRISTVQQKAPESSFGGPKRKRKKQNKKRRN